MTKYTQNEHFTIWYNTETKKFHLAKTGCQMSRTGHDIASMAIEQFYDLGQIS